MVVYNGLEKLTLPLQSSFTIYNGLAISMILYLCTVQPAKIESDTVFSLQLLSETLTCTLHLS